MVRCIVFILLAGGLIVLCTASAPAGDAVLEQRYGSGVHAYFSGDYLAAHKRFTAAIDGGTKDPRTYYFRGLANLKLGRRPEAKMDFQRGAELESEDLNRFYDVGKALERVQGDERLLLERYRVEARMAALEEAERIRKARYEAIRREEERVLREQAIAAPEEPIEPEPPAENENPFAVPEAENPFAVPEEKPSETPEEQPAEPKEPSAEPPAGEDPFSTEPKEPETKPDEPPAAEDPFAEEPKEKPSDESKKPEAKKGKGGVLGAIGKAIGEALGGKGKKPEEGKDEGKKDDKPAGEEKDEEESAPKDPFADEPGEEKPDDKDKPDENKQDEAKDPFAA